MTTNSRSGSRATSANGPTASMITSKPLIGSLAVGPSLPRVSKKLDSSSSNVSTAAAAARQMKSQQYYHAAYMNVLPSAKKTQSSVTSASATNTQEELHQSQSAPSSRSSKRVRFSEQLTTEVEISSSIYLLQPSKAQGGVVSKLQKAVKQNSSENAAVTPTYKSILLTSKVAPQDDSNDGISSNNANNSNNETPMNTNETNAPVTAPVTAPVAAPVNNNVVIAKKAKPVRPSLSEQLAAVTNQAAAITLDIRKKAGFLQEIVASTPMSTEPMIMSVPTKSLVVGSLQSKYPSPAKFYRDRVEFTFHHPFQASEISMIMFYRDLTSVALNITTHGGKLSFKIGRKMASFPQDFDPQNPMHLISIDFCSPSSAQDVKDKVLVLIQSRGSFLPPAMAKKV